MNEQGIGGAPTAPMYVCSQIAQGNDRGTTAAGALPMEQQQGIGTQTDYRQGTQDCTTQPDDNERANAARYRVSGFDELPTSGDAASTAVENAVENAVAQGESVVAGFQVHPARRDRAGAGRARRALPGDPFEITGKDTKGAVAPGNGFGEWNPSWTERQESSVLR
ncbi:hypothetical protein QZN11_40405 [Streptomyces gramineus]|uniref:hypothetical protein n=1 Tax=Streptomyces gramineus TaxID=910542 RepID=UPI00398AD15A